MTTAASAICCRAFCAGEGYRVTTAMSAKDARAKLLGLHFDLLILDVMMPGETGFDLARFIRTSSSVPIMMLTARHEAESRIEGLQIGADDYVAKPFEPRELVLEDRQYPQAHRAAAGGDAGAGRVRALRLSSRPRRTAPGRGSRSISPIASARCCAFSALARGETVPRGALTGGDGTVNERAVDVQINRLRRKIERDPANPLFLQAVRGIGYRLVASP